MENKLKQNKIWELYILLVEDIKQYMNLYNWNIALRGTKDFNWTALATLIRCEYTYYNAEIEFNNQSLLYWNIEVDAEEITILFIHEVCHIFTWAWSNRLNESVNKNNMTNYIGTMQYSMIINDVINQEEMNTNILDKIIFKWFQETKSYKDFKRDFTILNK